ncbi:MAG TPA: ester cyclase [Bryobacteraceae bacterium]|nr:ester cyclase [Bryobacteraceae bacterium]
MASDPASVARRWFEEAWNKGSERAIDELSAENVVGHGLGEAGNDVVGREHFRVFWRNLRTALPDLHVRVEDTVTEGDKVAIRIILEATHLGEGLGIPPSNERVKVGGIIIARIVNGQIAEAWNNWDQLALLQQIRAVPAPKPADRFLSAQI